MNQTAIDWLFRSLWDTPKDKMVWYAILDKAKEMEKEQIVHAYDKGESPFADNGKYLHGIDYYNETYGE